MTIRAGYFGDTITDGVTAVAAHTQIAGTSESRHSFLFVSDKTVHLKRSQGTEVDATTADMRVPADTPILLSFFASDYLSYILGTGETDGTIWMTKVDH